ncbi:MAG: FGGY-family carbohydrate kinase, partial [Bacillota bacterium]
TYDLLKAMSVDLGRDMEVLKVDGGASANNFLLQFQADILGADVCRPVCIETTSLGAAYLAGLATGFWESEEDVLSNWQIDRVFRRNMDEGERLKLLEGWHEAVRRTLTGF